MGEAGVKVIRVVIWGALRDAAGRAEVSVKLKEGATLADLMDSLVEILGPEAAGMSREYQWRHGAGVVAVVEGRAVDYSLWEAFSPPHGSIVHLVPPLSGG